MKDQNRKKKKRIDWRRVFFTVLAVIMALSMLLPLFSGLFTAKAATQSELKNQISSLKDEASDTKQKKKELQAELDAIQSDKSKALEQKKLMDKQLALLDEEIENLQSQIDTYTALIAEQEVALADATEKEEQAYELFCKRARSMEEAGTVSYWSVLFAAKDFSDLLDRLALVDQIMVYDNSVVDTLAAARDDVANKLTELNETKAELDTQMTELDVRREEQDKKAEEAQALYDELKKDAAYAEELVKMIEAEEKEIEASIAKKEKELEKLIEQSKVTFTTGTGYVYPLPTSWTTVTSQFGPRTDPITKKYSNHTGSDIAAAGGTPIYAVQGGVVITSAYATNSYGEYIAISHGNGIVTLYAHMTRGSRKVKEGDVVTQGQIIGLVGSTGKSTGNHLHIELKVNGVRQDPLSNLFPNVKFKYS